MLLSPGEQTFYGMTPVDALVWWLVRLMAPEIGVVPFRVGTRQSPHCASLVSVFQHDIAVALAHWLAGANTGHAPRICPVLPPMRQLA
jgi:hypothetical protein